MPPIHTQGSQNSVEQEGRILLANQDIEKQEITSIRETTRSLMYRFYPYGTALLASQIAVNLAPITIK